MEYGFAVSKQGYWGVRMNILLIGDPSGNDDEGMKKIGRKLSASLEATPNINARFAAVKEVFLNPNAFGTLEIIHYIAGPSWRSFVYAHLLKMHAGSKGTKTVISFTHPHWSSLASLAFRLFRPDAAVVQSVRWKAYCSHFDLKIWDRPIAGVNLNRFCPVSLIDKQRIRDELAFPKNKKVVLHVGHLNRGRNLLFLENLVKRDLLPVVIGSTTVQPDGGLVRSLEAAGVIVIHKYLESIEKFYQAADCYVFPTIDPRSCVQIPLSILEAMACSLPVVSTRFEGLPLFFPEGYPGITYVDELDMLPAKVYDALFFSAMPEPERLACFDWSSIAEGLRDLYMEILRNGKK